MDNNYWDIDTIFAQAEKLDCTFSSEVPNLGHIDGGEEQNIAPQTKMQLPYWLATQLAMNRHVEFRIPPAFQVRVRKALNAEPQSVRLSQLVGPGGSWYDFGLKIGDMQEESASYELSEILEKTFRARLPALVDQALHFGNASASAAGGDSASSGTGAGTSSGNAFREGLDFTERELFLLIQRNAQLANKWEESSEKR